jgi:FkbM family methyltransferase
MQTVTAPTRHGTLTYLPHDIYTGRALALYGEREEAEVQFLLSLVNPGDTVVDAGAHLGTLTLPLAHKVGKTGCVFAFEPQPAIAKLLVENLKQNDICNVDVRGMALSAGNGAYYGLPRFDYDAPNNFGGVALTAGTSIESQPLDFFDLQVCHLIKIDVEGMEAEVLQGAADTIKRLRPLLYVENDRPEKSAALITALHALDYELYWHMPPMFNPDNFAGNKENVFGPMSALNMLGVPREKPCDAAKHLRRVTSPYDRPYGATLPASVKPPNGWAGVARFGGIGDNLMAASAVGALKRKGLKVEVITSVECAWQVFEHNPNIDKLSIKTKIELPTDMLAWQKWFRGRADEFDCFAHLSHSCEGLLAFFPASTQFNWPAHVRRKLANINYLEMVHDIAGVGHDFGPLFYASEAEKAKALETKAKVGERCIALCMAGTRIDKLHPRLPAIVARRNATSTTPRRSNSTSLPPTAATRTCTSRSAPTRTITGSGRSTGRCGAPWPLLKPATW